MRPRPPTSTRTDTLFPFTTLCRSLRFERIDPGDAALELFEQAFVAAAEDAGEQAIEHGCSGWELGLMRGRIRTRSLASSSPNAKRAPGALFGNAILYVETPDRKSTRLNSRH